MLRALRSNTKLDTVQTSSPRKNLQSVSDDKENSPHMGHPKTEEPAKKPKKAPTLKNLKKENPPIPNISKRRCALRGILNSETPEEESAQGKSKNPAIETNKDVKSAGKKAGKTNLTQVKWNLPPNSLLVNKESFIVDELLEAADKDETCEFKNSIMHSFVINSPPYNKNLLEMNMLTSATPPESYWKELAQQREIAIEKVLKENVSLRDELEVLQVEICMLKNIVQQSEDLARIVKDIVE